MSLEAKFNLQRSRAMFMQNLAEEVAGEETSSISLSVLQMKRDFLEKKWSEFDATHMKIGESKADKLLETAYFEDKVYDKAMNHYMIASEALLTLIENKGVSVLDASHRANSTTNQPTRRILPEIPLPSFSGNYAEWRAYKDLFMSMVGRNQDLSNVEKLHFLLLSLLGEPKRIISNLEVTDDSFAVAWDLLLTRYDNKRILIWSHLEKLFTPGRIAPRSVAALNNLLSVTKEAVDALAALGCPVDEWDHVLVFSVVQRLDIHNREAWENKIDAQLELPSYSFLESFLTGRARAQESIELGFTRNTGDSVSSQGNAGSKKGSGSSQQSSGQSKPAQVLAANSKPTQPPPPPSSRSSQSSTTSSASQSRHNGSKYPCTMCRGDHFIAYCSTFENLSLNARKEFVDKNTLCFGCLGRHCIRECKGQKKCRFCSGRHHSLICAQSENPASRDSQRSGSSQESSGANLIQSTTQSVETPQQYSQQNRQNIQNHGQKTQ